MARVLLQGPFSCTPRAPRQGQNSVTHDKRRGEAPMRCLPRQFTSAVLPCRGCGPAPRPTRGASSLPAAWRCGCAASLGIIWSGAVQTPLTMDSLIDPVYQAQNLMRTSAPRDRFIQKESRYTDRLWHRRESWQALFGKRHSPMNFFSCPKVR